LKSKVHFPTDSNLLLDAMRCAIRLTKYLCVEQKVGGWRQSEYNFSSVKGKHLYSSRLKHSSSKDPLKQAKKQKATEAAYIDYIEICEHYIEKINTTLLQIDVSNPVTGAVVDVINGYIKDAMRQKDQLYRRVINKEVIPHDEKVFSLFERYTEWHSKGKIGVPVELGLKVCIVRDQYGFILHHRTVQKESDAHLAVPMVNETKTKFANLSSCSFDKGFYSKENYDEIAGQLDFVVIPKKRKII